MSNLVFIFLFLLSVLYINEGAKILGIIPSCGYSQYILGSTLMKELAVRGHEVTVISGFSQNNPVKNYNEVKIKFEFQNDDLNLFELDTINVFENIMILYDTIGLATTETLLKDENVQKLLNSNATFDLIICELFVNEAHMGFAYHYKAPIILFSSLGAIEWSNHLVANPSPFSHHPITFSGYSEYMNFWQRLLNAIFGTYEIIYKHMFIYPKQNQLLKTYFPGAPELEDLVYNSSLILLNSNVAMNAPVAHVPNMIEIGGFHVSSPNKLPKYLQDFLDKADDGAIFFSLGSNLKSSQLPQDKRDGILKAFSKLKQKVIWKWEDENLPGKPANVKIGKWFPQRDILAYPNIRAFISHGGLLSTTEAVYSGVPMICIPIFGDQKMNSETAVRNGYAVKILYSDLNEETLTWALNEIVGNTSYMENAQRRSRILKDQPLQPIDNAMFWIEYVLRHRGAPHLRTAALSLSWYQYLLLDVLSFILIAVLSVCMALKALLRRLFKSNKTVVVTSKKKKKS